MTKVRYIVECKQTQDHEWRFVCGTSSFDIARQRFIDASQSGTEMVRIRKKTIVSEVVTEFPGTEREEHD